MSSDAVSAITGSIEGKSTTPLLNAEPSQGDPVDCLSLEPIHLSCLPLDPGELLGDPPKHRLPAIKHLPLRQTSARRINSGKIDQPAACATLDLA
jgi:hypothetical protein